jgi:TldD protein
MLDVAKQAVEAARAAGADYADGRVVADDSESITVRNQEMEGIDRSTSEGLGIRVLVNGYWGFAATARQEPEEIERTAKLAVEIAKAAARLPMEPVVLAPVEPVVPVAPCAPVAKRRPARLKAVPVISDLSGIASCERRFHEFCAQLEPVHA